MDEVEHRRRRVRGGKGDPPAPVRVEREPVVESVREPHHDARPHGRPVHEPDPHVGHAHPSHSADDNERGLRGLIGGGSTQVGVAAAMRARDAARPTDEDLAHAEATLTIVHRGWQPREPA